MPCGKKRRRFSGSLRHRFPTTCVFRSRLASYSILQDLTSERTPSPEVLNWALTLWTERLVGGEAERADDQPAIILLSRVSPRAGYRICRLAGLCKLIIAGQEDGKNARPRERARREWLDGRLGAIDHDLRTSATRDVAAAGSSRIPTRRRLARLGLLTIARLVAVAEPFRLRWGLQHWPYPVAKLVRTLMPTATDRHSSHWEVESLILKTAWDRLNLEGPPTLVRPEWPLPKPADQLNQLK